jgi:hypothetical protein
MKGCNRIFLFIFWAKYLICIQKVTDVDSILESGQWIVSWKGVTTVWDSSIFDAIPKSITGAKLIQIFIETN